MQGEPLDSNGDNNIAYLCRLVGDGVELTSGSVIDNPVRLCLLKRDLNQPRQSQFNTVDFATSDEKYTELRPLELPVVDEGDRLCAEIVLPAGPNQVRQFIKVLMLQRYYPIVRRDDWKTAPRLSKTYMG